MNSDSLSPMSSAQWRMWLLNQLLPNKRVYNVPISVEWKGTVDVEALQRALNSIVARHEPLRTTFHPGGQGIVPVVTPQLAVPLRRATVADGADLRNDVKRILQDEGCRPFDLQRDPMVRALLLESAADCNTLLVTFHHIALDGRALKIFMRELAAFYSAFADGTRLPDLPRLPILYRDFAAQEQLQADSEGYRQDLAYWKKQLEGIETLQIPTDRPRLSCCAAAGAWEEIVLPGNLSERLLELRHAEGVSLFVLLLAAFQTLLHRYSAQDDICVGAPVGNRMMEGTEDLIGLFMNTVVLRAGFRPDLSFRDLLRQVRQTVRSAQEHQRLPFQRLVEELQPGRSRGQQALFRAMFRKNDWFEPNPLFPWQDARENSTGTAKFDLTLSVELRNGRIEAALEYSTELFDAATARRMLRHYSRLLEGIAVNPEQSVSRISILDEPDRLLLAEWNATRREYPPLCVHQVFEKQASQTPDATAILFENQSLTYRDLDRRANHIAAHLRSLPLPPESRIGICLRRSPDLVAALLGILKAGAAYVPLDPDYPPNASAS